MYEKLKKIRIENGYTGQFMANKLGISKVFYYQIESGKRRLTYLYAVKIAQIFDMKPDMIFYDDCIKKIK